jgi:carbonic anhydrase
LTIATVAVFGACASSGEHGEADDQGHAVHWGYDEDDGPERWAELSPDWTLCAEGQRQSPVDLSGAVVGGSFSLNRDYKPAGLRATRNEHVVDVLDNGHTIQVTYDEGSTLEVDGLEFELLQYHFHSPSEHTIHGRHAPGELHLVHQSADGDLAVIGVLMRVGAHNPALALIVDNLPSEPGETVHLEHVTIDIDELLPTDKRYYRYTGSLTTPPCWEDVRWFVMVEPIELSEEQKAKSSYGMIANNRPVQAQGGRRITIEEASGAYEDR